MPQTGVSGRFGVSGRVAGMEVTRRTLFAASGAVGIFAALGIEFVSATSAAFATPWVQYQHPFQVPQTGDGNYNPFSSTGNHKGFDYNQGIANIRYTSIPAIADGVFHSKGGLDTMGTYGNWVKISHGDGKISFYAHMEDLSPLAPTSTIIRGSTSVGQVGAKGLTNQDGSPSTAYHLHLGLIGDGGWEDPIAYINSHLAPSALPNNLRKDDMAIAFVKSSAAPETYIVHSDTGKLRLLTPPEYQAYVTAGYTAVHVLTPADLSALIASNGLKPIAP